MHVPTETLPTEGLPHREVRRWRIRLYDTRKYRRVPELVALAQPDRFEEVSALDFQAAREAAELVANAGLEGADRVWMFAADSGEDLTEPVVGMGATFTLWTDSYACTVAEVRCSRDGVPRTVVLRRDTAKLLNGVGSGQPDALTFSPGGFCGHTSGAQRWLYLPNELGEQIEVSRRVVKNGDGRLVVRWKRVGVSVKEHGGTCSFGHRHEHYDFNF